MACTNGLSAILTGYSRGRTSTGRVRGERNVPLRALGADSEVRNCMYAYIPLLEMPTLPCARIVLTRRSPTLKTFPASALCRCPGRVRAYASQPRL